MKIFTSLMLCSLVLGQSDDRNSIIDFSHELHAYDLEIKCTKCHNPKLLKSSMSSDDSILPTEKRCLKCHKKWKENNDCDLCHNGEAPYTGFKPPIRNFNFPHKIHYVDNKIECGACHGDMEDVSNFPPIPQMGECIQCHEKEQAPVYCDGCHTNVATIRPSDHSVTWIRDHDVAAYSNSSECQTCHIQLTCDNCHSGSTLSLDTDLPNMNPIPSYRSDMFVGKQLLSRNHSLDYIYNHGLDVTFKEKDCSVCHESSQFCSDCHQNNSDILLNKPDFHGGPDWGAIKYNSSQDYSEIGGGKTHALMAKRDIELCYSCHDLDGGDPICIDCHIDSDGLQNTDPKTHVSGYMRNTQGDWCTEPVSLCFVCHTNTETKGVGFCSYCHN